MGYTPTPVVDGTTASADDIKATLDDLYNVIRGGFLTNDLTDQTVHRGAVFRQVSSVYPTFGFKGVTSSGASTSAQDPGYTLVQQGPVRYDLPVQSLSEDAYYPILQGWCETFTLTRGGDVTFLATGNVLVVGAYPFADIRDAGSLYLCLRDRTTREWVPFDASLRSLVADDPQLGGLTSLAMEQHQVLLAQAELEAGTYDIAVCYVRGSAHAEIQAVSFGTRRLVWMAGRQE